jgi:hypothetical protein
MITIKWLTTLSIPKYIQEIAEEKAEILANYSDFSEEGTTSVEDGEISNEFHWTYTPYLD